MSPQTGARKETQSEQITSPTCTTILVILHINFPNVTTLIHSFSAHHLTAKFINKYRDEIYAKDPKIL